MFIVGAGEVGYFDVVHDGGEDRGIEHFFDKLLAEFRIKLLHL